MKSTTRTRNTTRPIADRLAISSPQLGPISEGLTSATTTPVESAMVCRSSLLSSSRDRLDLDQDAAWRRWW